MGSFKSSSGEQFTKKQIDKKVLQSKKEFITLHIEEHGNIFCSALGRNLIESDNDIKIHVSHVVSVRECQNAGRCEQAWNIENMEAESMKQHLVWERQFNSSPAITDIKKQKNFERKLKYIRENWYDKYLIIIEKLKEHGKVKNV